MANKRTASFEDIQRRVQSRPADGDFQNVTEILEDHRVQRYLALKGFDWQSNYDATPAQVHQWAVSHGHWDDIVTGLYLRELEREDELELRLAHLRVANGDEDEDGNGGDFDEPIGVEETKASDQAIRDRMMMPPPPPPPPTTQGKRAQPTHKRQRSSAGGGRGSGSGSGNKSKRKKKGSDGPEDILAEIRRGQEELEKRRKKSMELSRALRSPSSSSVSISVSLEGVVYTDRRTGDQVMRERAEHMEAARRQEEEIRLGSPSFGGRATKQEECKLNELNASPIFLDEETRELLESWKTLDLHDIDHYDFHTVLNNLITGKFGEKKEPYPYQIAGTLWLFKLYQYMWMRSPHEDEQMFGAVLADPVGTGKTLQVSMFLFLARIHELVFGNTAQNVLIVVPERKHIDDWCETLKLVFNGTDITFTVRDARQYDELPDNRIVLVRRATMENWDPDAVVEHPVNEHGVPLLMPQLFDPNRRWHCVVVDEAHGMRNGAQYYKTLKKLSPTHFRVALTATAIVNEALDLVCLFNWTVPGLLRAHNAINGKVDDIQEVIKPLFLRRGANTQYRTHCYYIRLPPTLEQLTEYNKHVEFLKSNRRLHFTFRRRMNIGNVFPGYPFEKKFNFDTDGVYFVLKPLREEQIQGGDGLGITDNQAIDRAETAAARPSNTTGNEDMIVHVADENKKRWIYIHRREMERLARDLNDFTVYVNPKQKVYVSEARDGSCKFGVIAEYHPEAQEGSDEVELCLDTCISSALSFMSLRTYLKSGLLNEGVTRKDMIDSMIAKSSKLQALYHISKRVREYKSEKMLIYTSFIPVVDIVHEFLTAVYGRGTVHQITGRNNQTTRKQRMNEFNDPDSNVRFLVSTFAVGSEGFNLQNANHVLFMDTPWTYAAIMQAIGRVQRVSQKRAHVYVYSLQTSFARENEYVRKVVTKRTYLETINRDRPAQVPSSSSSAAFFSDFDDLEEQTPLPDGEPYDTAHDVGCTDNSCNWKIVSEAHVLEYLRQPEIDEEFDVLDTDELNADETVPGQPEPDNAPVNVGFLPRLARARRREQREILEARHETAAAAAAPVSNAPVVVISDEVFDTPITQVEPVENAAVEWFANDGDDCEGA